MKILSSYNFREGFDELRQLGVEIIYRSERNLKIDSEIEDIDALICTNPFEKIDILDFPKLKWIQLLTTGVNTVPIDKLKEGNIVLTNNAQGYNIAIGEWIVMSLLQMAKKSSYFFKNQENSCWKQNYELSELYGKKLGFLGTGNIAQEAAKRLQAFEMEIYGINSSGSPRPYFDKNYSLEESGPILSQLDYLVLSLPYTSKTHRLVDRKFLDQLKPGVSLVNIARGAIVDEAELIKDLQSSKIQAAALDVFEEEPLSQDSPLWKMDNVIVSPHNSWVTPREREVKFQLVKTNIQRFMASEELVNLIDLEKEY